MLAEYMKYDIKIMFRKRTFQFAFIGMLCLAIGVPVFNLIKYWGEYEYALPSAHTLYIANGDGNVWSYLSLIIPFFISLPFCFSFLDEYKSGVILYVQTRGERKSYYYAQIITCFLGTAMVILIPFLLNILLNGIIFPVNGNDFVSTHNVYDRTWANSVMGYGFWKKTLSNGMIFKHIAIDYPQLYNVIFAFWAAFAMGVLSMFVYAISLLVKKQAIWLLIINYLFFQVFTVFNRIMEDLSFVYINLELTDYLANGQFNIGLVYLFYLLFLLLLMFVSHRIIKHKINLDEE